MRKYFTSPLTFVAMVLGIVTMNCLAHLQSNLLGVPRPLTGFILPTCIGALIGLLFSINRVRSLEKNREQKAFFVGIVESLSTALDMRDAYTFGHSSRVTELSVALARRITLSQPQIEALELGCILHDIGKIGISDAILNKPEKLDSAETELIQMHPVKGEQILNASKSPKARMIADCIRSHHEHFDGQGYPDQLKGEEIPLLARIITISDAFDAMISTRPYRNRTMTIAQALDELKHCSGSQFDPVLAKEFSLMLSSEERFSFLEEKSGAHPIVAGIPSQQM